MPVLAPSPPAPAAVASDPIATLARRAATWARLDHIARLVAEIEQRAASVGAGGTADIAAPAPPTTSADPLDELVAIDAAVVAEVLAIEANRDRLERHRRDLVEWRGQVVGRIRVTLAVVALAGALIAASVL